MGYDASVYVFQGLRFPVDETTLKRDLLFLSIFDRDYHLELLKECDDDDELRDNLYGNLSFDKLPNSYYMFYNTNYMYIGLFAHCYSVCRCNDGDVEILLPSDSEVEVFKKFCIDNNIDIASYSSYLFTVESY